jgi:hypothetical protein
MSNGYIVAAEADIAAVREIADGLGLELIGAGAIADHAAVAAALAQAPTVGLALSAAAAADENFTALMRTLAGQLATAQLILITPEARTAFAYLPETWPAMSLEDARERALAHARERQAGEHQEAAAPAPEPLEEAAPSEPVPAGPPKEDEPARSMTTEGGAPRGLGRCRLFPQIGGRVDRWRGCGPRLRRGLRLRRSRWRKQRRLNPCRQGRPRRTSRRAP